MSVKNSVSYIQDTFINKMRIRRKLTIDELSNKLGTSIGTVGRWCAGICVPRTNNIVKLADVLGVEYDCLLEHCKEDNENYKKHAKGAKKQTCNEKVEPNNKTKEKPKTCKNVLIEIRFRTDGDIKYDEVYDDIFDYVESNFDNSDFIRVDLNVNGLCGYYRR